MPYKGSVIGKSVDSKRRFVLPRKWLDESREFCFVANAGEEIREFRLYPVKEWEKELRSKLDSDQKADFAKRTTHMELKKGRLLLPKGCEWRKVDLIGVVDFIIVVESVV